MFIYIDLIVFDDNIFYALGVLENEIQRNEFFQCLLCI